MRGWQTIPGILREKVLALKGKWKSFELTVLTRRGRWQDSGHASLANCPFQWEKLGKISACVGFLSFLKQAVHTHSSCHGIVCRALWRKLGTTVGLDLPACLRLFGRG